MCVCVSQFSYIFYYPHLLTTMVLGFQPANISFLYPNHSRIKFWGLPGEINGFVCNFL